MRTLEEILSKGDVKVNLPIGLPNETGGAFLVQTPWGGGRKGDELRVIVGTGMGWEHVSVSTKRTHLCPTWREMEFVRERFFKDEDIVVQISPPRGLEVNVHPGCLHMWKMWDRMDGGPWITLPPLWMV